MHGRNYERVEDHPHFSLKVRKFEAKPGEATAFRAKGSRLGRSDSNIFHTDENCHHIQGERVQEVPVSKCWGGFEYYNIPCDSCTISRERFEELVEQGAIPEVEANKLAESPIEE